MVEQSPMISMSSNLCRLFPHLRRGSLILSAIQGSNTHELITHQSTGAGAPDSMDTMGIYKTILKINTGYDCLCARYPHSVDEINEILELMLEVICSTKKTIRIGGEDKQTEHVKEHMLKIDQSHLEYVLETLSQNTTKVRNIKSYLLTAIYNAPSTIGNYYKSRVNHDMCGGI